MLVTARATPSTTTTPYQRNLMAPVSLRTLRAADHPPGCRLVAHGPARGAVRQRQSCNSELHGRTMRPCRARTRGAADAPAHVTAVRRRARETAILAATRTLFDERGVAEAQIEDIARAVGINRAIVYRHFTGKEELFALALVGYLDELRGRPGRGGRGASAKPRDQLAALVSAFVDYGVAHPAFVDCAHSLMRRTGTELFDEISEGAMLRLGRAIASCLAVLRRTLEAGVARPGTSRSRTPSCWRTPSTRPGSAGSSWPGSGSSSTRPPPAYPRSARIGAEQVKALLLTSALAMARG